MSFLVIKEKQNRMHVNINSCREIIVLVNFLHEVYEKKKKG